MDNKRKAERYTRIYKQLDDLFKKTSDPTARMSTTVALLHNKFNQFFWTGFYKLIEGDLIVGPYQGSLACLLLERHKGVCWSCVDRNETVIVPDVHQFPGHIACDSRSNSEIVIPLYDKEKNLYAVLDIDSTEFNSFDKIDAIGIENILSLIFK